jgi:hypothetical protein
MTRYPSLVTRYCLLIATLLAAGCSSGLVVSADNYLTYEHEFTDAAAERGRQNAEKLCGQRKQLAVKTRSVCSLSRCWTDYQCVNRQRPDEYEPSR